MSWRGIVGRMVDLDGFRAHVAALSFNGWRPDFVVVHNTSAPDIALYQSWLKRANWTGEQWLKNLESYYRGLGWQSGPHAFVCPDGRIGLFAPLVGPGTHSPAWNSRTWGIETVGEFDREPFDGTIRSTLIAVLAVLHARIGLDPADYKLGVRGIHFHKEDPKTTHKDCPGKHMVKADLVADVQRTIAGLHPGDHTEVPEPVHTADTASMSYDERVSIYWLQAGLNKLGATPPLAADGVSGAKTRAAVRAFQQTQGLTADGVAGPLTRLALKAKLAA